jgi:ubiquinone biosynthesis protein UbiJ
MRLSLTPLLQTILENDSALEKGLESIGETIFNIHAGLVSFGVSIASSQSSIVKPHKNPDFSINLSGGAIKLVTHQHKFVSSMVEGDTEKFSALMSILTKAQLDCAVAIYDIFGNKAAFIFTSFISAYQSKKDKVIVNNNLSLYKTRLRAMQLRIDRVERLLNHRDHAIN